MAKTFTIVELDFENNVAFTDGGHIFPIEDYMDEDENPCLPEEAVAVNIRIGSTGFKTIYLEGDGDGFL